MAYVGDLRGTTVKFTVDGVLTDPTALTLKYSFGGEGAADTTWTYQGAGSIQRLSEGWYIAQLTAVAAGIATYQWTGTGAAQASAVVTEDISPLPLT